MSMTTVVESFDSQCRTPVTWGSTLRAASSAETPAGAGRSIVVVTGVLGAGAGEAVCTLAEGAAEADAIVLLCSLHQSPKPRNTAIATKAVMRRNPCMLPASVAEYGTGCAGILADGGNSGAAGCSASGNTRDGARGARRALRTGSSSLA